jgi:hypothetical protein
MSTALDDAVRDALSDILDLAPPPADQPTDTPLVEQREAGQGLLLAVAATLVVIAGTVGLLAVTRDRSKPEPAPQPVATQPAEPPVASPPAPELFPSLPDSGSRNQGATGSYSQIDPASSPQASVGIARRDGDRLVEGITITAYAQPRTELFDGLAVTQVNLDGVTLDAYTEPGDPAITSVIMPDTVGLASVVSGRDPVAFLDAAGLDFFAAKYGTGPGGQVVITVFSRPDGFQEIQGSTPLAVGAREASLQLPSVGNGDGVLVTVGVHPETATHAAAGPLTSVDINGIAGWASDGPGHSVTWQVETHTWATVAGATTTEEALTIARDLEFIDETTWRDRYDVADPGIAPATPPATPATATTPTTTTRADANAVSVLVVNASGVPGVAGSLTGALQQAGFDTLGPLNAIDRTQVDQSVAYYHDDIDTGILDDLVEVAPVARAEQITDQPTPGVTGDMLERADVAVIIGRDLAAAPWNEPPSTTAASPGTEILYLLDATTTAQGHARFTALEARLQADGITIRTSATTRPVETDLLMPIGETNDWTHHVADLAGIGGFDTWTPNLLDHDLPDDINAVLAISDHPN